MDRTPLTKGVTRLFTAAVMCWMIPAMANAEDMQRMLTVSGTGEVSAPPDIVTLSAGVATTAEKAKDALAANSTAMNQIFSAMKAFGIAEKDIQTSNFSISQQYESLKASSSRSGARSIVGYQVSNRVIVIVREIDKAGQALDAFVEAGANDVSGVVFGFDNPAPLLDEARKKAVSDARRKAVLLTESAGVTLGPVLTIHEGHGAVPVTRAFRMDMAEAAAVPIASGESKLAVNVTVSFAIE